MIEETVWNCEKALFSGCKYVKYGEPAASTPGVCKSNEVNDLFQEKSEKDVLRWLSFSKKYQDHSFRFLSKFWEERSRNKW